MRWRKDTGLGRKEAGFVCHNELNNRVQKEECEDGKGRVGKAGQVVEREGSVGEAPEFVDRKGKVVAGRCGVG